MCDIHAEHFKQEEGRPEDQEGHQGCPRCHESVAGLIADCVGYRERRTGTAGATKLIVGNDIEGEHHGQCGGVSTTASPTFRFFAIILI